MEALRPLAQDCDMNTELAKRMEAHRAACRDLAQDPLVALELADRETARRVWAEWKANRERVVTPEPLIVTPYVSKRQAE